MPKNRKSFGWTGKILRLNLTDSRASIESSIPYSDIFVGSRGINSKLIFDNTDHNLSPFSPDNLLCIGSGPLAGTPAPSSSRATLSALSPRRILDYSSIGGFVGAEIKFAGYDQIVISGRAERATYLYITNENIEFKSAESLWGKDPWQTQQMIREELGDKDIQSLAIGVAGENLVHFASVSTGRMTSVAGRGGLGAIMGSKNLKAIAVRGKSGVKLANPKEFITACHEFRQEIMQEPFYQSRRGCGSDKSIYQRHIEDGGKFVAGNWEASDWEKDGFLNLLEDPDAFWLQHAGHQRKAGPNQPGCFGCPMFHETFFDIPEVDDIGRTKCVEWLCFSGTVWINDRRKVNHAAYVCNKLGMDAISAGNSVSFLMELYSKGIITAKDTDGIVMKRGDVTAVVRAMEKIAQQDGFGKLFRKGVLDAAHQIGPEAELSAMQIKGLELLPEEIRAYKSLALITSVGKSEQFLTMDYSWGSAPKEMEQLAEERYGNHKVAIPNSYEGKAQLTWDGELFHTVTDLLGICKLLMPWGLSNSLKWPTRLMTLATGEEFSDTHLFDAARRTLLLERAINVSKGLRRKDETPPRRLFEQPVPDGRFKGEVLNQAKFQTMLDEYYHIRGCDQEGAPTQNSFSDLNLDSEGKRFAQLKSVQSNS